MPDTADASLYFVGNATMLIRCRGLTLLTDPNFLHRGQRAYLGWGLSTRRRTEPAMDVSELPPIDLVVLSHMHGDHWDRIAKNSLDKNVPIITTHHAAQRLRRQGFENALGLETWEDHHVRRGDATLTVTATPGRHAPGPVQALLPPVMGSVLDFGHNGQVDLRLHISGDTIMDPSLQEIPRRFPDIDVGVVHLGGTRVLGVLVTMDGMQGAEWVSLIKPQAALPIHYDDYEAFTSPLTDFQHHVRRMGLSHLVHYLMRGETYHLPARQEGAPRRPPTSGPV
ncbi:MBL fold metallo-hydrolase [Microbispora sp. ATCC PTA-5024]|uniref:MBL fold metallo-hydrolase n=1 Tax=Microbispora sp. ATCC PTA-5024 TaxID=316330 RepID=UPI0003DDF135|nr:MBL fold metallo-hydrolase [Microbispora sp. ATCC PTA-5024]ETK34813.1 lactamase B [Microbispora sp. ATCC PTA-5024]